MHLNRLFIRGFRSIRELDLKFTLGKNIIIGRNNAGKSNIIRALDIVLGESAPAWAKSDNITEADFCSFRTRDNGAIVENVGKEISIWCQLERESQEDLDWEEINKCFGFSFYSTRSSVRNILGVPNRLQLNDLPSQFINIFDINDDDLEYGEKVWVDSKPNKQNSFQQHLANKYQFAYAFFARRTDKGIDKQLRFLCRESSGENWMLCFKASIRTELLQSAILPSFRDPAFQLRITPWTWFGKLMKHLTKDCAAEKELSDALEQLRVAGNNVFAEVTGKIENNALSVSFPDAKLSFQFAADTKTDIYKSCIVYVDDGFKSLITDKGAGIQSATILGLFSYYTKHINTTGSALLCVEEPELYLHPHARRVISDRLDDFLDGNRNQVIATTHGIEFLRTANETFNLLLVRKDQDGFTTAQSLDAKEFLDLLVNNNQNELFFADKVVLCEGFDEHILRAAADELYPGELDQRNISIVSLEGKDRMIKMAEVVLKLGIDCYVFADFDFLLRDKVKQEGYDTKPHPSVQNLPIKYFFQPHVGGEDGSKLQKYIIDLRDELRKNNPKVFYEGKHVSEFGDDTLLEALKAFREYGVGILNGEVEHLSKDASWVNASGIKFKLKHVYEMREKLNAGTKISEMFDLTPLQEFFAPMLGPKKVEVQTKTD